MASAHGAEAALLVGACRDAVNPDRRSPGAPGFAHTSSGTPALDRSISLIGFAPQGATSIIKGFNPVNPHNGSTIVATVFWLASENIVDSVSDYLTTSIPRPPVPGNPFTLVEYVTVDGISMATYVATNVQNFPDGYSAPAQDSIYAVQANFRTSVTNVGLLLSAWTGVEPVFASALGAHRSLAGSASTQTLIGPGALTVGANSLVYAAVVSNAVVGSEPPGPPFAIVRDPNTGPLSVADATIKAEAVSGVPAEMIRAVPVMDGTQAAYTSSRSSRGSWRACRTCTP